MRNIDFNIFLLSSLFLALILLFSSCQDNTTASIKNLNNEQQTSDYIKPTVQENSLVFRSRNDFNGFMQELQQQSSDEVNEFVQSKAKGFTSLKQAKEKVRKSKTATTQAEKILQLNVEDPNFASILNENGVFQVGEQVFKITNQYTYIFKNRSAFESFSFLKSKMNTPTISYIQPCETVKQEPVRIQDDVYRVENCGGGGGGGSYDPGDDDESDNTYPNSDVINLDPNDNLDIDYPSKRTQEYRSGGTKGRLKGKSWNQNFYVFSSVGTKSVHERHTWGKWWNRSAEKITLESFIKYSYGERKINPTQLKRSLKVKLSDLTDLIGGGVDYYIQRALNLAIGEKLSENVWHAAENMEFTIVTQKVQDDRFTYNISPSNLRMPYSKTKLDAKKISKTYDWSTAIVSFPPGIKQKAVDFKLEILRSKHTLKHDGYHLGFITDKRE